MRKIANTQKTLTDDIYYVSAADVADKLIERMRRGLARISHDDAANLG